MPKNLLDYVYRANPCYELITLDEMTADERQTMERLVKDQLFYGILRPLKQELSIKAVCTETANFFEALITPQVLSFLLKEDSIEVERMIHKLLADQILEIKYRGNFLTGSKANRLLTSKEKKLIPKGNLVNNLSAKALKYATALSTLSAPELSLRLYLFNKLPVSPVWQQHFLTPDKIKAFLELDKNGRNARSLKRFWTNPTARLEDRWFYFRSVLYPDIKEATPIYKLYVSPLPKYIPHVFTNLLEVLPHYACFSFKTGNSAHGLLRADKIVAYFHDFHAMNDAATALSKKLIHIEAQGVPFTAQLDKKGLLAWGLDPPLNDKNYSTSWRRWITDCLAASMITAHKSDDKSDPVDFALRRLELAGIDINSWTPTYNIWNQKTI